MVKPEHQVYAANGASSPDTEEKIFRAALFVFARDGHKGATMQEIAAAAGINKALVHYYFRNKERLYAEVCRYMLTRFFSPIGDLLLPKKSFSSTLRSFIDVYVDTLVEHPEVYHFLVRELTDGAPVLRVQAERLSRELEVFAPRLLFRKIEAAMKSGEIRRMDPMQLLITLIGACAFFFLAYPLASFIDPTLEKRRDTFVEERKKHIYDIIHRGIRK